MASSFTIAEKHLTAMIEDAAENNVDLNALGQAVVWKLFERYRDNGRKAADIADEVKYTLDNLDDDGTFHVSRN